VRRIVRAILCAACLTGARPAAGAVPPGEANDAVADSSADAGPGARATGGASRDSLAVPDRSWAWRPAYPVAEGDSVRWLPLPPMGRAPARILVPDGAGSEPLWRLPVHDLWDAFGLHVLLRRRLATGSVADAESCASALARFPNVWEAEGVNAAADLALARGDTARALTVLGGAAAPGADPLDTAARAMRRAALLLARRDTANARASCRRIVRSWPALAPAREALATLDRLAGASSDSLDLDSERAAAEVEVLGGDRGAAIRRLQRVFPAHVGSRGLEMGLRLAEIQRQARRFADALATLELTRRLGAERAEPRLSLERARVHRDAGRADSAYAIYAFAAGVNAAGTGAETALWELAREAEQRGEWDRARLGYAGVELLGGSRASDAALRLGLAWLAGGERRHARACFSHATGEAARFWWAVAARDSSAGAAGAVLHEVARRPGYTFYRACARETLGVRGWPVGMHLAPCGPASPGAPEVMRWLVETGMQEEAGRLMERWAADDPAAGAPATGVRTRPDLMAEVARLAFAEGSCRPAIRIATRALEIVAADSSATAGPESTWSYVPALYPPLYDSLFAAVCRDPRIHVEPELLRALVWKESHFDSAAVSRSGALGLTQLLPPAAADMARALRVAPPDMSALLKPEINLWLGARYLRWLLDRTGGSVPLALAAYNAGPTVAQRWRGSLEAGGEALLCELAAYPETQDYMKSILAVRQAYRELRPRVGRP